MVSGGASVIGGTGSVVGSPTFSGHTMTINLTGVIDAQTLTISLTNLTDTFSQVIASATLGASFLIGDTNGDRMVNAGDAVQTRDRSGQATDATNFRSDVNLDGLVNSGDTDHRPCEFGQLGDWGPGARGCRDEVTRLRVVQDPGVRRNAGEGSIMNKRRSAIAAILIGLCAGWHEARATEPGRLSRLRDQ